MATSSKLKEAIAIVLDVGSSKHNNQSYSSMLEEAKKCICAILQRKIFVCSKDEIALILFGTYLNPEEERDGYLNVSIVQDFQRVKWEFLDYVKNIKKTKVSTDPLIRADALFTAIDFLWEAINKRKYISQKILFISNSGDICSDKVHEICKKLKKYNISLDVIGPKAFSVKDFNFEQHQNEVNVPDIRTILKEVKGESYSFNGILHGRNYYPIKLLCSNPWKGNLELEVSIKSKSISIPIKAYIKLLGRWQPRKFKIAYEPEAWIRNRWKRNRRIFNKDDKPEARIRNRRKRNRNRKIFNKDDVAGTSAEQSSSISNYERPSSIKELISAYTYGTTFVPLSDEVKRKLNFEPGDKGIKILGFTKSSQIPQYLYAENRVTYIFADENVKVVRKKRERKRWWEEKEEEEKEWSQKRKFRRKVSKNVQNHAGIQLAAFIHALYDTKMVALARLVVTNRSPPKIGFLSPKIKSDCEHLIFIALPFAEDIYRLELPSLDSNPNNIPTEEQLDAVNQLINAMDMTNSENDEELLKPKSTSNPYFQRVFQCLEFRSLNPEKPLPKTAPHIEVSINPSPELLNRVSNPIKRIENLFPLKKHETFQSGTKQCTFVDMKSEEAFKKKPSTNDYIPEKAGSLDDADKITEVGCISPIRDFEYLVSNKVLPFNCISDQLMNVVFKFMKDDIECVQSNMCCAKILSICKAFRRMSLKVGSSDKYNFFMVTLKNLLLECEHDLWNKIKNNEISLISNQELPSSTVSFLQAQMFLESPLESENEDDCFDTGDYLEINKELDDSNAPIANNDCIKVKKEMSDSVVIDDCVEVNEKLDDSDNSFSNTDCIKLKKEPGGSYSFFTINDCVEIKEEPVDSYAIGDCVEIKEEPVDSYAIGNCVEIKEEPADSFVVDDCIEIKEEFDDSDMLEQLLSLC